MGVKSCLIRKEEEAVNGFGNEMNVFEEMAAEWQRRLAVITAALLASESASERRTSLCSPIHLPFSHRQTELRNECRETRKLCSSVIRLLIKARVKKETKKNQREAANFLVLTSPFLNNTL